MSEEIANIQILPNSALVNRTKETVLAFVDEVNLDESAKKYIIGSLSENTIRAYQSDLKIFRYWCEDKNLKWLPATPNTIANFLSTQALAKDDDELKAVTIIRRTCAVRYAHQLAGFDTLPTNSLVVRKTLRGIMRQKLIAPDRKKPATADIIKMMADMADDSLIGIRDRAILLVGFAGAFRRSELVAMQVDDIDIEENGMAIMIRKSKTDQVGEGKPKPILRGESYCPVAALQFWLRAADIASGYVFRQIKKGGRVYSNNDPEKPDLSDRMVANIVKKYADMIGLDSTLYSGHSLRRGFITSALLAGASIAKTMEVSQHKDPKTTMRYFDDLHQFEGHAGEGLL